MSVNRFQPGDKVIMVVAYNVNSMLAPKGSVGFIGEIIIPGLYIINWEDQKRDYYKRYSDHELELLELYNSPLYKALNEKN